MTDSQPPCAEHFQPENMSPELRAVIETLEKSARTPVRMPRTLEAAQAARSAFFEGTFGAPAQKSKRAETRTIEAAAGPMAIRVFPAQPCRGVLLQLHGGGWFGGTPDMQDPQLDQFCERLGLSVVSPEYRLAPEHPYPAGPDDCEAAALWLTRNAQSEFGTDRLLIGGDSSGAHLAAVTILRMRDRHGYRNFRGANLMFGLYDLSGVPSQDRFDGRNLILDSESIHWFTDMFVPEADRRDPDISPLYANLEGLPPALFSVGTFDPLLDHSLFMYMRWLAGGNRAEIAIYPGGMHGFNAFPIPEAHKATQRVDAFLESCLH